MSETPKCPFCGTDVAVSPFGHIWCDQCDYRLETEKFNRRPIEDKLRGELRQAIYTNSVQRDQMKTVNEELQSYANALYLARVQLENATRWIPVGEKLPEDNVWCLVGIEGSNMAGAPNMWFGYRHNKSWYGPTGKVYLGITHWMPMLEPPEAPCTPS